MLSLWRATMPQQQGGRVNEGRCGLNKVRTRCTESPARERLGLATKSQVTPSHGGCWGWISFSLSLPCVHFEESSVWEKKSILICFGCLKFICWVALQGDLCCSNDRKWIEIKTENTVSNIIRIIEVESIDWSECIEMFSSWILSSLICYMALWLISPCGLGFECAAHFNKQINQSYTDMHLLAHGGLFAHPAEQH